jgi:hypothetical protein
MSTGYGRRPARAPRRPGAMRAAAEHDRLAPSPSPNGRADGSITPRQMRYPGKNASICQFLLPAIRGRIAPAIF